MKGKVEVMFDFSSIMTSLGFEAEPIINAFNVCAAIIEETREFALKFGCENDADSLCFDFNSSYPDDAFADAIRTRFVDDIWRGKSKDDSLTAQIVTNCYNTTFDILEDTELFKTLGACFCGSMPLTFKCDDGKIHNLGNIEDLDTNCGEKICSVLSETLIDKLHDAINKSAGGNCKKEWVENDFYGGAYEWDDVMQCLQSGKAEGSVTRTVSVRASTEQSKKCPVAERE